MRIAISGFGRIGRSVFRILEDTEGVEVVAVNDLFAKLASKVTPEDVNEAVLSAAESSLQGILEYSKRPIVSSDIIGNSHSSIYDAGFTAVTRGHYLRVLNWYDNEWGYSSRVCDLLARLGQW
jgi:glyceraldehyde 3-phosphate dehydrogenase